MDTSGPHKLTHAELKNLVDYIKKCDDVEDVWGWGSCQLGGEDSFDASEMVFRFGTYYLFLRRQGPITEHFSVKDQTFFIGILRGGDFIATDEGISSSNDEVPERMELYEYLVTKVIRKPIRSRTEETRRFSDFLKRLE